MYLEQRKMQTATVLDCYGKFEEEDHEQFMTAIESLHVEGCQHLVLNLTSIYRVDGNIVNLLTFAHEFYSANEARLTLVTPLSAVRRELEDAAIPQKIPTYLTVYDALHRQTAVVDKTALPSQLSPFSRIEESRICNQRSKKTGCEESPFSEMAGAGMSPPQSLSSGEAH